MRAVSAIAELLAARCVCVARTMLLQDVCPSDHHTPVYVKRLNILSNFFHPYFHTILVFSYQTLWQYLTGTPEQGRRIQGCEKIGSFDISHAIYRLVLFPMTLSDLPRGLSATAELLVLDLTPSSGSPTCEGKKVIDKESGFI